MPEDIIPTPHDATAPAAFFHADSNSVRFWVRVGDTLIGATVSRLTLHHHYRPEGRDEDPMETHRAHLPELEAAVRKRVARGSIEPVMLREYDLRIEAAPPEPR